MDVENIKDILQVYQENGIWMVDATWGYLKSDPLNMGYSAVSREEAYKNAMINLCVEWIKGDDFEMLVQERIDFHHSSENDNAYAHIKQPTREKGDEITEE